MVAKAYSGDRELGLVYLTSDVVNTRGYSSKPIDVLRWPLAAASRAPSWSSMSPSCSSASPVQGGPLHQRLCRPELRRHAAAPRAAAGGHRQRRHGHADGDRRQHHALGHRGGAPGVGKAARPAQRRRRASRRARSTRRRASPLLASPARQRRGAPAAPERGRREPGLPRLRPRRCARGRDEADAFIELYVAQVSAPAIGRSLLGETGWLRLKEQLKRAAGGAGGGRRPVFVQGAPAMCAAASSTASKSSSTTPASASATATTSAWRTSPPRRARREWRCSWCRKTPVRSGGAMAPATHGAARAQRLGQGLRDLRPGLRAAGCVYACGPASAGAAAGPATATPASQGPRPPARQADAPADEAPELWRQIWNGKPLQIAILTAALAVLAGIFFFQDQLARRPLLRAACGWPSCCSPCSGSAGTARPSCRW